MVKKTSKTVKKSVVKKPVSKSAKASVKKAAESSLTKKSVKKTVKKPATPPSLPEKSKKTEKVPRKSTVSLKNRSEKEKELFEKLKELLLQRKMKIIYSFDEASQDTDDDYATMQSNVGDVVDTAADATEIEINLKLAEYGSRELGQIDEALAKMNEGSYGVCEDCGGNITMARIKALPFASRCIKCQQEEDENSQDY